jgi:tetratricopeptide (TPR) repeat protein
MIETKILLLIIVFLLVPAKESPKQQIKVAETHLQRARDFELDNDPRAEKEYKLAISAKGGNYPEALREFSFYLQRRIRFSEAVAVLQEYIEQTPSEEHADDVEELNELRQAARLKRRIQALKKPLLQDLIEYSRLVSRYADNQSIDALPYAERAVRLYPDNADAYISLARTLVGPGQDQRRCQALKKAIDLGARLPSHYFDLGNCELILGDWQAAANAFQKTLDLSNGAFTDALEGLGLTFAQLGRKKEAVEALRRYLETTKTKQLRPQVEQHIKRLIEQLEKSQ